ncbi:hypothetical protein OI72_05410 [Aeromonas hydrophila]|nr:hypothetical protein OI72_05410 [Aeromonas hydrophila]
MELGDQREQVLEYCLQLAPVQGLVLSGGAGYQSSWLKLHLKAQPAPFVVLFYAAASSNTLLCCLTFCCGEVFGLFAFSTRRNDSTKECRHLGLCQWFHGMSCDGYPKMVGSGHRERDELSILRYPLYRTGDGAEKA